MAQNEIDKLLDHDADGIKEFDNALPKWWLYGFYFTIAFAIGYMVYYHMMGGPLSAAEYQAEIDAAKTTYKTATISNADARPLSDPASLEAGRAIFEGTNNVCFTCHRADLGGQVGPNLTDDYWLHGGQFADIMHSITTGYPEKGMLPYGSGAKLSQDQLLQVASYVWSKHGSNPPDPKPIDPERDRKVEAEAPSAAAH